MTKDLTKGNIFHLLISFLLPVLTGQLLQQVYNLADTAIVGRTLGVLALGGVGSTGSLHFLIIGFADGVCTGFGLPVSQAFGAENKKLVRKYVTNAVWLAIIIAVVLCSISIPLLPRLLVLMKTPTEQYDYAFSYFRIILMGIPATILYNLTASVIRSLGDSKTPVMFLGICSALNILGDLLFILVFGMGVAGAALATVISQLVSGVMCLIYMKKKYPILRMEKEDWKPESTPCSYLLSNGIPMGLQFSITAIGAVILQSAINSLGAVYVSANSTGHKINQLLMTPFMSMITTIATFTGQNLGAREFGRIKRGVLNGLLIGLMFWAVEVILILTLKDRMLLLFLNENDLQTVKEPAMLVINIVVLCYVFLIPVNVIRPAIQGMSFSKLALVAGAIEMAARVSVALFGVPAYGYTAACFAAPLAWVSVICFLIPAFFICLSKRRKELESPYAV